MGRNTLRNIFITSLLGLTASGCAGLSSQSGVKFPGYHAADGISSASTERTVEPRDEMPADFESGYLADYRYRSQYGIADYSLLSHIYGPYAYLSLRERHLLDYQRRLGRMGYGLYYDPYYSPYSYGWQGNLWGSMWYDPWGWDSWYGDPFYYSSRYRYGYSYGYGSGYYGYRGYAPVYGSASGKGTAVTKRRGRNRKDGAGSTFGSRFSGTPSYADAPRSSGNGGSVTKSRSRSRDGGSVKSSGGKSRTKSSGSSGKTSARRSKRKK